MQILGYFISLVQFFANCWPKIHSNEINSPKNASAKYFWKVFKNRSNEIHTNEIRIRQEPSVLCTLDSNLRIPYKTWKLSHWAQFISSL